VLFWVHGGGNLRGASSEIDAGKLALQRQVLVVVPNYRLGPLGWLSHPALEDEAEPTGPVLEPAAEGEVGRYLTPRQQADAALASDDRSGNYGTLDLIAALQFVRENAARFGGDPENVTIAGQGSGAGHVLSLLLSPRAKGLFRHAIAQSPRLLAASMNEARAYGEDGGQASSSAEMLVRLLMAEQRAGTRAEAKAMLAAMSAAQIREYLRARSAAQLVAASVRPRAVGDDRPEELSGPLRDGAVIHAEPALERFASGDYTQVPILLGSNRDEVKRQQASNPELVVAAEAGRNRIIDRVHYELLAEDRSDAWRALTVNPIASRLRAAQGDSVFVYRFDWDEQPRAPYDARALFGAAHGFELPFVFGVFEPAADGWLYDSAPASVRRRAKLSRAITSYWSELAYQSKPGSGRAGDLWEWEPWGEGGDVLVLATPAGGDVRMERGQGYDVASLLARLASDPRAPAAIDKCRVLFWLTERGEVPARAYATTPGIDCKAYPVERYPWADR
jgi:para-nitrobenzyl esterase